MIPKVQFRTCRSRRGYKGNEAIMGDINKESKSIGVMVHDGIKTHRVREECVGARPTQEVLTNFLI
jgi:hypothetical protein